MLKVVGKPMIIPERGSFRQEDGFVTDSGRPLAYLAQRTTDSARSSIAILWLGSGQIKVSRITQGRNRLTAKSHGQAAARQLDLVSSGVIREEASGRTVIIPEAMKLRPSNTHPAAAEPG